MQSVLPHITIHFTQLFNRRVSCPRTLLLRQRTGNECSSGEPQALKTSAPHANATQLLAPRVTMRPALSARPTCMTLVSPSRVTRLSEVDTNTLALNRRYMISPRSITYILNIPPAFVNVINELIIEFHC